MLIPLPRVALLSLRCLGTRRACSLLASPCPSAHPFLLQTLNLTCTVFGNPDPEVTWFKNDQHIELSDHFSVKVEQAKYVSLTIQGVTAEDSGKYSISVKNKYGGEKIDVTVSVYKHGEKIPEATLPQQAKPKLIPAAAAD